MNPIRRERGISHTTFTRGMGIDLGMVTFLFVYEVRLHDKKVGYRYRLGICWVSTCTQPIPNLCCTYTKPIPKYAVTRYMLELSW